ncbi:hypothetical protein [Burkholderia sp. LMG 32019]|uniref:hypothetical protein n=1 Tax=Burkholderia sp. LMG 32019 TaxID=3158173 RepID=UPI003C3075A4
MNETGTLAGARTAMEASGFGDNLTIPGYRHARFGLLQHRHNLFDRKAFPIRDKRPPRSGSNFPKKTRAQIGPEFLKRISHG